MRTIALALALLFAGSAPALAKKHRARAHKTAKHKAKRTKNAHAAAPVETLEPSEPSVTIPPQHSAPAPTPTAAAPVSQADDDEVPGQRRH